jgi:hypothetical protein
MLLLLAIGTAPVAWSATQHHHHRKVDRQSAASRRQATKSARVKDTDQSFLPSGFVDISLDSSGVQHAQGMVAIHGTNAASFYYDERTSLPGPLLYGAQASFSNNDGASWALSNMPSNLPDFPSVATQNSSGNFASLSDPTTAVDSQGRFYIGGGGPDQTNRATVGQKISAYVMRSDDGGADFTAINNGGFNASEAISMFAGDPTDFLDHQSNYPDISGLPTFVNNDYVSVSQIFTQSGNQSQTIQFAESNNAGVTWSAPVQVSDTSAATSGSSGIDDAVPDTRTDLNGNVYVDWTHIDASGNMTVEVDHTSNTANVPTFGTDVAVSSTLNTNANLFDAFLGDIRTGVFTSMAIDTSGGANSGNVYVCWTDQVPSLGNTFKVFVARSTDGGNTFSAPVRVDTSLDANGSNSDHQQIPTIGVNPAGQVVLTYISTRNNPSSRGGPNSTVTVNSQDSSTPLVDLLYAVGTPNSAGSIDFATPYQITPSSLDVLAVVNAPNGGNLFFDPALGDYNGIAFAGNSSSFTTYLEFADVVTGPSAGPQIDETGFPFTGAIPPVQQVTVATGTPTPSTTPSGTPTNTTGSFTLQANPQSVTIAPGQTANYNITVTPQGGFNGTVTFSAQGLPAGTAASFNPPAVSPNGSAASTTLSIATSAPSQAKHTAQLPGKPTSPSIAWLPVTSTVMGALLFLSLGDARKRRLLVCLLAFGALSFGLAGCGGGSDNNGPTVVPHGGTPRGSYQIIVTATGSNGATQSIPVTLNVD